MFCYQCEQTDRSGPVPGCTIVKGTCGKDETTADLQDLLLHQLTGIGQWAALSRAQGAPDDAAAEFCLFAAFTTLTNVNFNAARFVALVAEAAQVRDRVRDRYLAACAEAGVEPQQPTGAAVFVPATGTEELLAQARTVGILAGLDDVGADVVGLRALNLYGLKGVCAYAHHAAVLGETDPQVLADVENAFAYLASAPRDVPDLLQHALALGTTNLAVMGLLDKANTGRFGTPTPTQVRTSPRPGKAVLVSGHDLGDLQKVLEATAGTGVDVYTHGELLPAHAYPVLAAYPHLAGNYGGAWQDQQVEFATFPGPIVMTSNCLIEPQASYRQRIFTMGPVGWAGVRHLTDDLSSVVAAAKSLPGFTAEVPETTVTIGFGGDAVLGVADTVIDAVKSGAIRHFFLVGGCDGAAPGRNYYTEFVEQSPDDTVVLTLGCAKYRFNSLELGDIGGIPRLLDVGQCNDSYSAIRIASALAEAFDCGVNDLPLSLVLSWFEQKAAAVLLTLLALGIRNMRLGPTLPAFLTPAAVDILVAEFGLQPIGDPAEDLRLALTPA